MSPYPQAASSLVARPPDLQRWLDYTYLVATRTSKTGGEVRLPGRPVELIDSSTPGAPAPRRDRHVRWPSARTRRTRASMRACSYHASPGGLPG